MKTIQIFTLVLVSTFSVFSAAQAATYYKEVCGQSLIDLIHQLDHDKSTHGCVLRNTEKGQEFIQANLENYDHSPRSKYYLRPQLTDKEISKRKEKEYILAAVAASNHLKVSDLDHFKEAMEEDGLAIEFVTKTGCYRILTGDGLVTGQDRLYSDIFNSKTSYRYPESKLDSVFNKYKAITFTAENEATAQNKAKSGKN